MAAAGLKEGVGIVWDVVVGVGAGDAGAEGWDVAELLIKVGPRGAVGEGVGARGTLEFSPTSVGRFACNWKKSW